MGDTAGVRGLGRKRLGRGAGMALPLVVALFLVSLVESVEGLAVGLTILGMLAGAARGAALWWRRRHPELVMLGALAGGLVVWLVAPEGVFPFAGLVAI